MKALRVNLNASFTVSHYMTGRKKAAYVTFPATHHTKIDAIMKQ